MTDEDEATRISAFEHSFHSQLVASADEVVGVDNSTEIIESLVRRGEAGLYAGDVESLNRSAVASEPPFDVIVIGDLIEHLSNPGLMLDQLAAFLRPAGEIIVTTPNAFSLPAFARFVLGRFREGEQHTLNFNLFTLENLLGRHGWHVAECHTCYQAYARQKMKRVPFLLGRWLFRRIPRFGGTLLVVAVPR